MYKFSIESVVWGYHEHKDIWDAAIDGVEFPCERKPGNPHDPAAVAVAKRLSTGTSVIVGHVPRIISMVCSIFIHWGGSIVCVVTGLRQYSADLLQGGLEVPCCYTFKTIHDAEGEKARKIIEGMLSVKIIATTESNAEGNIGGVLIQVPGEIPPDPDEQSAVTREIPESSEPPHKKRKLSATEIKKNNNGRRTL